MIAGNGHNFNHFIDVRSGNESEVYADSAYKCIKHDHWLEDRQVYSKVVDRAFSNRPLTPEQKNKNLRNSGNGCTVARVFGL